jgi:hypothetical protein
MVVNVAESEVACADAAKARPPTNARIDGRISAP